MLCNCPLRLTNYIRSHSCIQYFLPTLNLPGGRLRPLHTSQLDGICFYLDTLLFCPAYLHRLLLYFSNLHILTSPSGKKATREWSLMAITIFFTIFLHKQSKVLLLPLLYIRFSLNLSTFFPRLLC